MYKNISIKAILFVAFLQIGLGTLAQTANLIDTSKMSFNFRYEITLSTRKMRIQYTRYGLLLAKFAPKNYKKYTPDRLCTKFISSKELVKGVKPKGLILYIFNYIHNAKIMEIDSIKRPPRTKTIKIITQKDTIYKVKLNIFDDRPIMNIRIFNLKTKQSSYLIYDYYDKRIYKLIKLVNEIIPKKYREKYEIRNIWIAGTPTSQNK